jgi:hypothetical protein
MGIYRGEIETAMLSGRVHVQLRVVGDVLSRHRSDFTMNRDSRIDSCGQYNVDKRNGDRLLNRVCDAPCTQSFGCLMPGS